MQLIPDMATDLGRPNEDNTEWTFTLREASSTRTAPT